MNYASGMNRLAELRTRIASVRAEMRQVQSEIEPEPVADYAFTTPDGPTSLSALFGAQASLFVVHNMGVGCAYCTLWADGYNGVYAHLAQRAAFVVTSPDAPAVQSRFASQRGWRFPLVSHAGTSFAADMGYVDDRGRLMPGVSVFQRRGDEIMRVSTTGSQPLDDLCVYWHLLELLPEGAEGWAPRISYKTEAAPTHAQCALHDLTGRSQRHEESEG